MKKKYFYSISILILTVILISACAPSKSIEKERIVAPDRLIKKLEANRRKIKSFEGSGIINIQNSEMNAKSNFEVEMKKPDSIKVSFFGPFGIDLAQALISSNGFQFYDIINNNLYKGILKDDVIRRILKVNVSFDEIIDALTGSVNLTDKLRVEPDKYEVEGNLYKLTYIDSTNSIEKIYLVRVDDFSIVNNIIRNFDGKVLFEGKYSNFRTFEDVPVPFVINLNDYRNKQVLKIDYKNINVNKELSNIKIEVPNDVKVIEW